MGLRLLCSRAMKSSSGLWTSSFASILEPCVSCWLCAISDLKVKEKSPGGKPGLLLRQTPQQVAEFVRQLLGSANDQAEEKLPHFIGTILIVVKIDPDYRDPLAL